MVDYGSLCAVSFTDGGCTKGHPCYNLNEVVVNGKTNNSSGYEPTSRDWDILNMLKTEMPNLAYDIQNRFDRGEYFQLGGGKWDDFTSQFNQGWLGRNN